MKRGIIIAILILTLGSVAKADNIVSVVIAPTDFGILSGMVDGKFVSGDVTMGVGFDWNTTTQTLSNFVISQTGPFGQGMPGSPSFTTIDDGALVLLDFFNKDGALFQLNSGNHGGLIPPLPGTPGTYLADLDFFCPGCGGDNFKVGTATVAAISEPGTLALLGVGLVGLLTRKRKKPELSTEWEPLA